MPGTGALILLAFAAVVVVLVVVLLLVLLQLTRLGLLVRTTIPDRPRRRSFLASVSFLITFAGVRVLVSTIVHRSGPFQWVTVGGHHIHHLVWGILILLLVGYGWLLDLGQAHTELSIFFSRLMSISYGVGAALTLRVRTVAEPCTGRLLVERGTAQYRRGDPVWQHAGCRRVGRAVLSRPASHVDQAQRI